MGLLKQCFSTTSSMAERPLNRHISVAFLGGLLLAAAPFALAEKLKIATGEWVPYVSASYLHHGAIGHVIEKIFADADIDVEFNYLPWARGYQMSKDGAFDGNMPYYCSPERQKDFYCSDPIVQGQQVYFYNVERPFDWETIADLEGMTIGATLGYYYGEDFENAERTGLFTSHRVARDETNFLILFKNRINAFPQDKEVGYAMIRRLFTPEEQRKLTHHHKPIHTNPLHLIFPRSAKHSERYLQLFNEGLARLRDSGELSRYMNAMSNGVYEKGGAYDPESATESHE